MDSYVVTDEHDGDESREPLSEGDSMHLPYNGSIDAESFPGLYAIDRDLPDAVSGRKEVVFIRVDTNEHGKITGADARFQDEDFDEDDDEDPRILGVELSNHDEVVQFLEHLVHAPD